MPYLIDGHNLIPFLSGINLSDLDDEIALIQLLQSFARRRRTKVVVFFDQAPPTRAGSQSFGRVTARFVRQGTTADAAIKKRLQKLGKSAKNWTVVSGDRQVALFARSAQAHVVPSRQFAEQLESGPEPGRKKGSEKNNPRVTEEDLQYWLDVFSDREDTAG